MSTTPKTGAMIALVPSEADLDRLTVAGGEPRDELHLTLWYLGDAADIDVDTQRAMITAIHDMLTRRETAPLRGNAFGVAHWNPTSDEPAWVLNVGNTSGIERHDNLGSIRSQMTEALDDGGVIFTMPQQHTPWQPHVCIAYSSADYGPQLEPMLGDLTLDRVRIAFADEVTDFSLTQSATVAAGSGGGQVPWHKVHGHAECTGEKPWAVVKDSTGEVAGCHASEADADSQLAALYANENAINEPDEFARKPIKNMDKPDENDDEPDDDVKKRRRGRPYAVDDAVVGTHEMPDGSVWSDEQFQRESRWDGVLVVEGTPTGDGREFSPNALSWVEGALLRWQKEGSHGGTHDVTVSVGRIDGTWRDNAEVRGYGVLDLKSADGFELYRRLKSNFAGGISIDADDILDADIELVWPDEPEGEETEGDLFKILFGRPEKTVYHGGRIRAATLVDIPAFVEARIGLTGDREVTMPETTTTVGAAATHSTDTSDGSWDDASQRRRARVGTPLEAYAWTGPIDRVLLHHELSETGELGPANLTACATGIAALNRQNHDADAVLLVVPDEDRAGAYEHLAQHLRDAGHEPLPLVDLESIEQLVASIETVPDWRPPTSWFENPDLKVWVPITVSDQGRVYGHMARWGECHIGFEDMCVTPPFEDTHPYFMTGEVVCADGSRVAVGQITLGTGHAPLTHRASRAAEHYDNTGCAVADVVVGNDDVGIWVAGSVRSTVSAARVHELRASGQVSGDWRRIGGQLRLVGLLAVNVPGFPVPRLQARVASGVPMTLVAAGLTSLVASTAPTQIEAPPTPSDTELDQLAMRRVMNILARRVHDVPEIEGAR